MKRSLGQTLGALSAILILAASAAAQTMQDNLDGYFSALARNRQFNGHVLIAENGRIIYEKSFGYSDFPNKRLNTKNTLFPLASISKTLTATAILQLTEDGTLRLADPVAKHIPEFPYPDITIRHLMSHTSGLPPYNAFFDSENEAHPERVFSNADFIPCILENPKPLLYRPGEKWNYDNVNYLVLALVLERVSGTPFHDYIRKHVLQPAGMKRTRPISFSVLFDPAKKKDRNVAIPHWYPHCYSAEPIRADAMPYVSSYWRAYEFAGFGDYVAPARDLLEFAQALDDGRLLSERVLAEAFTPVKLNDGDENHGRYGLGWATEKDASLGDIVVHGGNAIGLSCILLRNLTKRQTVVFFDIGQDIAHSSALSALKILNGEPVPAPRRSIAWIYGRTLLNEGPAAAKAILEKLGKDTARYELNEEEFNRLGYDFLGADNPYRVAAERRYAEALHVFKLNVELFPASWNVYDSYGEALLKTGMKEDAIQMYQKSIELNPKNENGIKALEQLLKKDPR